MAQFGADIPIVQVPQEEAPESNGLFMAYHAYPSSLVLGPRITQAYDVKTLAALLVHEATHAVFFQESLDALGVEVSAFVGMTSRCPDIAMMDRFCSESLAYANAQLWCDLPAGKQPCHADVEMDNQLVRAARQHVAASRASFAYRMLGLVKERQVSMMDESSAWCGPPIIQRGKRRQSYFFSSDLAPEFLVPLLDAIQE